MSKHIQDYYISASSLDDLLGDVFRQLLRSVSATRATKGNFTELYGMLLEITNPRARLSRSESKGTIFSCLGELSWYLSGSDELEYIEYYVSDYRKYSDDGICLFGAYGPRIHSQIKNVIDLLASRGSSRRAVVQIYDGKEMRTKTSDLPCTCTLQFLIRKGRLHLITYMRSNDAFKGLPHDIFAFTMLQEIIAITLNVEVGIYKHMIGSLHLYNEDRKKAEDFIDEGFMSNIVMPNMPGGNPWKEIELFLKTESSIRKGGKINYNKLKTSNYWLDLIRLLDIFRKFKEGNVEEIKSISKQMSSNVYHSFIYKKIESIEK